MIPKVIHYCWLSSDPLPLEAIECIQSWKINMPEYKIKRWDMSSFDCSSHPFVAEAIANRKWAFACDYIRCYALFVEGGIYLDSDVFVRNRFDFALDNKAFSAIESYPDLMQVIKEEGRVDSYGNKVNPDEDIHGIQIQAAILGSESGHPFFRDCLDYYDSHSFDYVWNHKPRLISPIIMANLAVKYGFKYLNEEQALDDGFRLYGTQVFAPQPWFADEKTVAIHCCNGSWRRSQTLLSRFGTNLKNTVKRMLHFFRLYDSGSMKRIS